MKKTAEGHHATDTIAAIATPAGEGGIGIVRISGTRALEIAATLFCPADAGAPAPTTPYKLTYGRLMDPESGETIDEVLLSVMRAPRSYTREDVVEINCHAGLASVRATLDAVLRCGARLADPGEFTKRAFLNGRIDLAQAEAVIDVIRARTDRAARVAGRQLRGGLSRKLAAVEDRLLDALALLEAAVDFSDEDVGDLPVENIMTSLDASIEIIETLLQNSRAGAIVREGVRLAIVGRPNVGKSSLLNALLQTERAIVTSVAGTTRDTIEEGLDIDGVPFVVVDTAGIRETRDAVEAIGVSIAERSIAEADVVLCVFDANAGLTKEDQKIVTLARQRPHILVGNKSDLMLSPQDPPPAASDAPAVLVSALRGDGLSDLKQACVNSVLRGAAPATEDVLVSNARHADALRRAAKLLTAARQSVGSRMSEEFPAADIRGALLCVGEITGSSVSDEILNRIFEQFCIGK